MFLNLLMNEEQQQLFLDLAALVSIANPEEMKAIIEKTTSVLPRVDIGAIGGIFASINFNKTSVSEVIDEKERQMLQIFAREMNLDADEALSNLDRNFGYYISKLASTGVESGQNSAKNKVAEKSAISKKTNVEKASADSNKFLTDLISIIISRCESRIPSDCKKAIVFELLGIAIVDGSYSDQEKLVIAEVCRNFSVSLDLVDEMAGLVFKLNDISRQAMELVME